MRAPSMAAPAARLSPSRLLSGAAPQFIVDGAGQEERSAAFDELHVFRVAQQFTSVRTRPWRDQARPLPTRSGTGCRRREPRTPTLRPVIFSTSLATSCAKPIASAILPGAMVAVRTKVMMGYPPSRGLWIRRRAPLSMAHFRIRRHGHAESTVRERSPLTDNTSLTDNTVRPPLGRAGVPTRHSLLRRR